MEILGNADDIIYDIYFNYRYLHGWQKDFMAVKKLREFSSFAIYSYLIESAFKAVKGMQHSEARKVKGVPFVNERYTFCQNWHMYIKGHRLDLQAEPHCTMLC